MSADDNSELDIATLAKRFHQFDCYVMNQFAKLDAVRYETFRQLEERVRRLEQLVDRLEMIK